MTGIYTLKKFENFVESLTLKYFKHIFAQTELIEVLLTISPLNQRVTN